MPTYVVGQNVSNYIIIWPSYQAKTKQVFFGKQYTKLLIFSQSEKIIADNIYKSENMSRIQKVHPSNHLWKVLTEPENTSAIVNRPSVTTWTAKCKQITQQLMKATKKAIWQLEVCMGTGFQSHPCLSQCSLNPSSPAPVSIWILDPSPPVSRRFVSTPTCPCRSVCW